MAEWQNEVDTFCYQYLQLESDPILPRPSYLKISEVQDAIYSRLFASGVSSPYKPSSMYQIKILKALVSQIEASIDDWNEHEVSGDLMAALADLLSTPTPSVTAAVQQKSYVTYHLSALAKSQAVTCLDPNIILLENRYLIAASGTTGLRTWEAALHLGHYLCQNVDIIKGKRVLELGAGTGFLSILCARHLSANHVIASDGSDEVVYNLPENMFLNGLQHCPDRIMPMDVKWGWPLLGTEEEKWNGGREVDVVLGADITYDKSVIAALVSTMTDLFSLYPSVEMYVSATQRNEETFQVFLDRCRVSRFRTSLVDFKVPRSQVQKGPFYSDTVDIRVLKITK